MEPGSKYEDLITRYLLNEASPEEQEFVLDWMKADEKNLAYVEELKRTLQLFALKQGLDQVDINQEWEKFRNEMLKKQQSTEQSPNIEWEITDRRKQRTRIYKIVISSAVAASFIVFFGVRNGWFTNNIQPGNSINQQAKAQGSNTKIDPLMAVRFLFSTVAKSPIKNRLKAISGMFTWWERPNSGLRKTRQNHLLYIAEIFLPLPLELYLPSLPGKLINTSGFNWTKEK
jgi:hypothetical protein